MISGCRLAAARMRGKGGGCAGRSASAARHRPGGQPPPSAAEGRSRQSRSPTIAQAARGGGREKQLPPTRELERAGEVKRGAHPPRPCTRLPHCKPPAPAGPGAGPCRPASTPSPRSLPPARLPHASATAIVEGCERSSTERGAPPSVASRPAAPAQNTAANEAVVQQSNQTSNAPFPVSWEAACVPSDQSKQVSPWGRVSWACAA